MCVWIMYTYNICIMIVLTDSEYIKHCHSPCKCIYSCAHALNASFERMFILMHLKKRLFQYMLSEKFNIASFISLHGLNTTLVLQTRIVLTTSLCVHPISFFRCNCRGNKTFSCVWLMHGDYKISLCFKSFRKLQLWRYTVCHTLFMTYHLKIFHRMFRSFFVLYVL